MEYSKMVNRESIINSHNYSMVTFINERFFLMCIFINLLMKSYVRNQFCWELEYL